MCKMDYHIGNSKNKEEVSTKPKNKQWTSLTRTNVTNYRTYSLLCMVFILVTMYSISVTVVWYWKLSSYFRCGTITSLRSHGEVDDDVVREESMFDFDRNEEKYFRSGQIQKLPPGLTETMVNTMSQHTDGDNEAKAKGDQVLNDESKDYEDQVVLSDTVDGGKGEDDLEEQLMKAENTINADITSESSAPTSVPAPNKNEHITPQKSKDLVIDIISIGCKSKEDYMQAQKDTWALHPSIRNFWPITESDDANPNCMYEMHISNHLSACKKRKEDDSDFMRSVRTSLIWTEEQMQSSKNPWGWLCAQRRVGAGLAKVGKWYRTLKAFGNSTDVIPEYLFVIDDDTFINMRHFNDQMKQDAIDPAIPMVYGGCLIQKKWKIGIKKPIFIEWNFPFGGYGLMFSKGSVERLIHPLYCNLDSNGTNDDDLVHIENSKAAYKRRNLNHDLQFEIEACKQLKLNYMNEIDTYKQGSSISDIAGQLSARDDFCMHSDWLTGYLANYYPLSTYNASTGKNIHQYGHKKCEFERTKKCSQSHHICHYQTPKSMKRMSFAYKRFLDD